MSEPDVTTGPEVPYIVKTSNLYRSLEIHPFSMELCPSPSPSVDEFDPIISFFKNLETWLASLPSFVVIVSSKDRIERITDYDQSHLEITSMIMMQTMSFLSYSLARFTITIFAFGYESRSYSRWFYES